MPLVYVPHNAVGLIISSYRHFLAFILYRLLLSTLFRVLKSVVLNLVRILCTTSFSHPPSTVTCHPRFLKQSTTSNGLPFALTCIRTTFTFLWHLITYYYVHSLSSFFVRILYPNLFTSLHNFSSESATSAVSSENTADLSQTSYSSSPLTSTRAFTSRATPFICTLKNHEDATQPCLNPKLTGNHSLTSIPPWTHSQLST